MKYYQYLFNNISHTEQEILIALLIEIGFDGFEEDDDQLKAYTTKSIIQGEVDSINDYLKTTYSKSVIPEINWNEKWEKDFNPVTVYNQNSMHAFVNIRAHFHPILPMALHDIIITPKMSFGTGHHATTYGMIECMSKIDFSNKDVIDFGTGTGVLAILAEKLGAARITAIDNDEWSINNAAENIKLNKCSKIEVIKADNIHSEKQADIILANTNLNVIVSNMEEQIQACKKGGIILFSGMLINDKPFITAELKKYPIIISEIYEKNNWIVIVSKIRHE